MFEQDNTGILQGYFDRMHPTVQTIIEHMIQDPSAQIDVTNMSLVWRGWVRPEAMEVIFGDIYDADAQYVSNHQLGTMKGGVTPWIVNKPSTYPKDMTAYYGAWMQNCCTELRFDRNMNEFEAMEYFRTIFVQGFNAPKWISVTEAMVMLVEGEGEFTIRLKTRGWCSVKNEVH